MMIDKKAIEEHVRGIIAAIGDDPEREGLKETPERVARMCERIFAGTQLSNEEIARMYNKSFGVGDGSDDIVLVKDIECFSYCEHHMALMYDMKISVAYIPCGRVLGLSKIARIADTVCRRLQLQERIGTDIAEVMQMASGSEDVAVFIEAKHSCMSARGIKKPSAATRTMTLRGRFKTDKQLFERLSTMLG
ncbi:MAG: GTP cyclohydrolase I [Oscillospiraceae bacterium]|nr:GTP cyclohydrolase I [Oscillospiraceae bacterium]